MFSSFLSSIKYTKSKNNSDVDAENDDQVIVICYRITAVTVAAAIPPSTVGQQHKVLVDICQQEHHQ